MRRIVAPIAALSFITVLGACDDEPMMSAAPLPAPADPIDDPNRNCGTPIEVASLAELEAIIGDTFPSANFDSQRGSTGDLVATNAISFTSTVARPTNCTGECERNPTFVSLGAQKVRMAGLDRFLIEQGAEFRVRYWIAPLLPLTSVAQIVFDTPCKTDCFGATRRCAEDNTCYGQGAGYCVSCDHRAAAMCACTAADDSMIADGTTCQTFEGDVGFNGTCQNGECTRSQ